MSCIAPPTGPGFLAATLANLDCQAQTIGEAGYQALSAGGSPVSLALGLLLAIFVGLVGIRFLTGRPLGVHEWVAATLKLGFVLALATSWPAYRTVVYDLVLKGPAEISGVIGAASGLPGAEGGLAARLAGIDDGIMALVEVGSGRLDVSAQKPANAVPPPLSDDLTLGLGKTLFVGSVIGSFGLLRLAGGLFLALAPFFAGFLLFEATRFLFFGWLRALIAVALGSVGVAVVLGVELAVLEPWLSQVLGLRAARIATLSAPFELLATSLAFALGLAGVLFLAFRIGFSASVIARFEAVVARGASDFQQEARGFWPAPANRGDALAEQSRAQLVAQSVRQTLEREQQNGFAKSSNMLPNRAAVAAARPDLGDGGQYVPLGRSYPTPSRTLHSEALKRNPRP